jgi:uncharacterized sporulation protein YeaH/YhbH (DUF444 family)
MDVSVSMGEREKDLAKKFFILQNLFLKRKYEKVAVVYISHTTKAQKVDEQEFFYGKGSGGTLVSSALELFLDVANKNFSVSEWNRYVGQASDGGNLAADNVLCAKLLEESILPTCQHFAYIEIAKVNETPSHKGFHSGMAVMTPTNLWKTYADVAALAGNLAMKQVRSPGDIYPVFRQLYTPKGLQAAAWAPHSAGLEPHP